MSSDDADARDGVAALRSARDARARADALHRLRELAEDGGLGLTAARLLAGAAVAAALGGADASVLRGAAGVVQAVVSGAPELAPALLARLPGA